MDKLRIFKVGGKVIEEEAVLKSFLHDFAKIEGKKMLVHGGGRTATEMSSRLNIVAQMVEGRRVTDEATLEVVTMVYGGLINKKIVAHLQSLDVNALGLTGADLNILRSAKRLPNPVDYGFVGDIEEVDSEAVKLLVDHDKIPVFAPLTHDKKGQLLNTNADSIASGLAVGLASHYEVELYFCFEKKGVLADPDDDHSVIPEIKIEDFSHLKESGVVSAGMIPKLEGAFDCIRQGVSQVNICHYNDINELEAQSSPGTVLIKG